MNKSELDEFIDFTYSKINIHSPELFYWVDSAINWQVELGCINYLLSQLLEKKKRTGIDCNNVIAHVYQLTEHMSLYTHGLNSDFINYMYRKLRDHRLSLEDELVKIHDNLNDFIYD